MATSAPATTSQASHPGISGAFAEGNTQREVRFEERIQQGERIEPKDWMPERYRKQLTRMISQHALQLFYTIGIQGCERFIQDP